MKTAVGKPVCGTNSTPGNALAAAFSGYAATIAGAALVCRPAVVAARKRAKWRNKAMIVANILNDKGSSVATARPDTTIAEVAAKLAAKKIGAVVIVGGEGLVDGILSERDIIRAIAQRGQAALSEQAADIMTRQVTTCTSADTLDHLMATMTSGRFRHMPVVEDGRLVGIVSIGDVVKRHIAEVEMEATALRNYVVS
jgi:CBS domain-containing protein